MRHLHKVLYQNDFKNLETLIISYNSKLWRRNQIVAFESKSIIFMAKPKGVSIKGNLIIGNDEKEELEKNTRQIRMLYNPNDI